MAGSSRNLFHLLSGVGSLIILFLFLAMLGVGDPFVKADDSSNGDLEPTTLYMKGEEDELDLESTGPNEESIPNSKNVTVDEMIGAGYVYVGTWKSDQLDKDLHVEGDVTLFLFLNSTDELGPGVRFRITIFGENHETEYYGTNPGISRLEINFKVPEPGWDGNKDERVSMNIQVDADDKEPPSSGKEITLHYWNVSRPGRIEFPSDATDIAMEANVVADNEGVKYFEICVNITDAFGEKHFVWDSFILNITSKHDPDNYTAKVKSDGSEEPEYLDFVEPAEYWGAWGYTSAKYFWYYEGRHYANGVQSQGVEPGDYWMKFTLNDTRGNERFLDYLEAGVSPIHVHVNIHTDDGYITIIDCKNKDVPEVAAHDDVRVRIWIEINKGRKNHMYGFYVELKDNGALLGDYGPKYVQMEGKTGKFVYFQWDPTEGAHELSIECDSDGDIDEVDESDNEATRPINVIPEARPQVVISHPAPGEYINEDVYILFDASNTTNPITGEMTFDWTIYKWNGDDWEAKTALDGDRVITSTLLKESYGAGQYKALVNVENEKREATGEVVFSINSLPHIELGEPRHGNVYFLSDEVPFDAHESGDEDGDTLYFLWYSNIDGILNKEGESTNFSMASFSRNLGGGMNEITLELTDYDPLDPPGNGRRGKAVKMVTVLVNRPPLVKISSPVNGSIYSPRSPIEFNGTETLDPDGQDLSFIWYDGQEILTNGSLSMKNLIQGWHEIRLEVNDGYLTSVSSATIYVGDPPTARAQSYRIVSLKNGIAWVTLDASPSNASDEFTRIVNWIWDRDAGNDTSGDGIPDNDADNIVNDPIVALKFNATGLYHVILFVVDSEGISSDPFTVTIIILEEKESDENDEPHSLLFFLLLLLLALLTVGLGMIVRIPGEHFANRTGPEIAHEMARKNEVGGQEKQEEKIDNDSFKPPDENRDLIDGDVDQTCSTSLNRR